MRRSVMILCICFLLFAAACGRSVTPETASADAITPESASADAIMSERTEQTAAAETETEAARTVPDEATSLRTLPGMIMSDVYVSLWDGDTAPGLRAEDAQAVKRILASLTWGMSYDNLSDVWIETQGVRYAYDTQSGILTEADNRAAKLSEAQRIRLNGILAEYLPGYEEGRGFFSEP
ncbi:MAG: hypothetical protein IJT44_06880 [Clostridia bacterium]|nr:hypothetical protein [Clostridia bacterium]